jgi:AcrR family transcriptional regulator
MLDAALEQIRAEEASTDPKARTRARILREATQLFQRQGYRKVSVDEVAQRAGVAKGTVYLYFKNKAELLLHALMEEKKPFLAPGRELLMAELEPRERLIRYLEMSFTGIPRAPLSARLMSGDREILLFLQELPEEQRGQLLNQQDLSFHMLLEGIGAFDRLDPVEREQRVIAFKALVYSAGPLLEERLRGGLSIEQYARQLAKVIVEGIGAP